jgi:hypothetical protein
MLCHSAGFAAQKSHDEVAATPNVMHMLPNHAVVHLTEINGIAAILCGCQSTNCKAL